VAHDEWDKHGDHYTYEYHSGIGGHISRRKDNSPVLSQKAINKPMTRPEAEEALQD
jgi:hypothetical protein